MFSQKTQLELELYKSGFVKSNYNLHCFCCNNPINIGDEITHCVESVGMKLRSRINNDSFYTPFTGNRWVHKDCKPYGLWTLFSGIKYAEKCNEYDNENDSNIYYDICDEFDEYDSQDENLLYVYNHYNKNH
jgi:hypothetical protein